MTCSILLECRFFILSTYDDIFKRSKTQRKNTALLYAIQKLCPTFWGHIKFGKGFSVTNLKQMRKFYNVYTQDVIGQTVSDQLDRFPITVTGRKFFLSWSHYLQLMRIDN